MRGLPQAGQRLPVSKGVRQSGNRGTGRAWRDVANNTAIEVPMIPPQQPIGIMPQPSFEGDIFICVYARAFASFDAAKVASMYGSPCLLQRADKTVTTLATEEEAQNFFDAVLAGYRADGMTRFDARDMSVTIPGPCLAGVTCTWDMIGPDGSAIRSWRQTYMSRHTEKGWRILLSFMHPD
jgi:ketosteroid isomerase-like protein